MAVGDKILQIIAEEIGVEPDELTDDCEFAEFGVDNLLSNAIVSRVREEIHIDLPSTIFFDKHNVSELKNYLRDSGPVTGRDSGAATRSTSTPRRDPLSFVLQGTTQACKTTIFLLPDGSGAAMAYARLPRIDPDVCLVALNSPYLHASSSETFSVGDLAERWATEIQTRQQHGPYLLGGWSAGGYYTFEVAKHLMNRGEKVDKLVLIDSPCRLVYEALPMEVVETLSTNNLMGNWGSKAPPEWMINHFRISIRAIENYMPTPMQSLNIPDVFIVWAEEGMLKSGDHPLLRLNMDVKVTRMLVERPEIDGAMGWEKLFPGATVQVAKMPGNHFTIVYPPYCNSLSALIKDVVQNPDDRVSDWQSV